MGAPFQGRGGLLSNFIISCFFFAFHGGLFSKGAYFRGRLIIQSLQYHDITLIFLAIGFYLGLASCTWGPVTANGVDLLTKMYVIYMEANTSHCTIRSHVSAKNGASRSNSLNINATDVH